VDPPQNGANREHALEVLADSWYHLLCDEG